MVKSIWRFDNSLSALINESPLSIESIILSLDILDILKVSSWWILLLSSINKSLLSKDLLLSSFNNMKLGYLIVFAASFVARGIATWLLKWVEFVPFVPERISMRILAIRPSEGSIDRPILSTLPEEEDCHFI